MKKKKGRKEEESTIISHAKWKYFDNTPLTREKNIEKIKDQLTL